MGLRARVPLPAIATISAGTKTKILMVRLPAAVFTNIQILRPVSVLQNFCITACLDVNQ